MNFLTSVDPFEPGLVPEMTRPNDGYRRDVLKRVRGVLEAPDDHKGPVVCRSGALFRDLWVSLNKAGEDMQSGWSGCIVAILQADRGGTRPLETSELSTSASNDFYPLKTDRKRLVREAPSFQRRRR